MSDSTAAPGRWYRVLGPDELPDGRVKTVTAGHKSLAMTHYEGKYGALDNRCPHQGGPLGEGSIEKGLLRCPWHGWDYDPLTGKAPGFDDGVETFPVEIREDEVYVTITLNSGQRHEIHVEHATGSPENPMSDIVLRAKYDALAREVLPAERADDLWHAVWTLDEAPDVSEVVALMQLPRK